MLIFSKLWNVLGTTPNHTKTTPKKKGPVILSAKDVVIKKHTASKNAKESKPFYPGYDESAFLDGAEKAFYIILEAHHKQQHDVLKKLVSPALCATIFSSPTENIPTKVCVISIDVLEKSITSDSKHSAADHAFIAVRILSQRVFHDRTEENEDVWTFSRPIKSKRPSWTLCDIKNI